MWRWNEVLTFFHCCDMELLSLVRGGRGPNHSSGFPRMWFPIFLHDLGYESITEVENTHVNQCRFFHSMPQLRCEENTCSLAQLTRK